MADVKVTDADREKSRTFWAVGHETPSAALAIAFADVRAEGFAAGVAAEREAFTPPPSDEDKEGGWSVSTDFLAAIEKRIEADPNADNCYLEQIENVLLAAAAIRAGEVRG